MSGPILGTVAAWYPLYSLVLSVLLWFRGIYVVFFLFSFSVGCVFEREVSWMEYRSNSIANVYQYTPNSVSLRILSMISFKWNNNKKDQLPYSFS